MGRAFEGVSRQGGGAPAWSRARSNGNQPYPSAYRMSSSAQRAQMTKRAENCVREGAERGCRIGGQGVIVR